MYIIDPSADAEAASGKQVLVVEAEDGTVRIEHRGRELSGRAFAKDGRVQQAAVVENKALAGALLAIQAKQREREELVLSKRKRSLREEDLSKRARGEAGQPNRRNLQPTPSSTPRADPILGRASAWAQAYAATQTVPPDVAPPV
jgi:hypothetical protein